MWKKAFLIFSLFALFVAVSVPSDSADAARKSFGKKSYSQTPSKAQDNVSKSTTGTTSKTGSTANSATKTNRGFFSGGSLMKGLMIGGFAGLLFGSMFSGMGFMGDFLGLIFNVIIIVAIIAVIRALFVSFRRKKDQQQRPNDARRW